MGAPYSLHKSTTLYLTVARMFLHYVQIFITEVHKISSNATCYFTKKIFTVPLIVFPYVENNKSSTSSIIRDSHLNIASRKFMYSLIIRSMNLISSHTIMKRHFTSTIMSI